MVSFSLLAHRLVIASPRVLRGGGGIYRREGRRDRTVLFLVPLAILPWVHPAVLYMVYRAGYGVTAKRCASDDALGSNPLTRPGQRSFGLPGLTFSV